MRLSRAEPDEDLAGYLHLCLEHHGCRRALYHRAQLFVDPGNEVYLSVVAIWEILVKFSLGRLPLPEPPERFIPKQRERHGIAALALEERAPLHLYKLPSLHKDPFDRMLVCQTIQHEHTF